VASFAGGDHIVKAIVGRIIVLVEAAQGKADADEGVDDGADGVVPVHFGAANPIAAIGVTGCHFFHDGFRVEVGVFDGRSVFVPEVGHIVKFGEDELPAGLEVAVHDGGPSVQVRPGRGLR